MKTVFMGTPDFAVPSLQALLDGGEEVLAVFTQPDKPKGRGYKLTPPPVKELALRYGLPVYQPSSLKKGEDAELALETLRSLSPDLIVVVAYGKILPKEILELPKFFCVNVHASLLPKYRGAGPIQWCLLHGEEITGVTTQLMGEGIDTGDMLLQASIPIEKDETADELEIRLAELGARTLMDTLAQIQNGTLKRTAQDDQLSTHAPMLSRDMCQLDFSLSAQEVHNRIRGLSSWPCAKTTLNGKALKIYRSTLTGTSFPDSKPGDIVKLDNFTVACGDGMGIQLLEVQAEGGKRMKSQEYLRGKPICPGTRLQ